MSSTDAEPGTGADQAYFLALERAFLALRGQATLLSAEDWQAARAWHRAGMPLEFVVAVMEAAFARQRERRSKRGISSLRYFRAAVDAAWDERLRHLAGGGAPPADPGPPIADRLRALTAALPAALPERGELAAAIGALSGAPDEVEVALEELERRFLDRFGAGLDAAAHGALESQIDRALAAVPAALPESERRELRDRLRVQGLRRAAGLPILSLFSPAALPATAS